VIWRQRRALLAKWRPGHSLLTASPDGKQRDMIELIRTNDAVVISFVEALLRDAGIEAPGQLARHYSPGKPLRLDARDAAPDEFLIGFGEVAGDCSLSPGDLALAAARLYDCLHRAAASDKPRIAVAPVPGEGIGAAINDRLRRAAA